LTDFRVGRKKTEGSRAVVHDEKKFFIPSYTDGSIAQKVVGKDTRSNDPMA
jgi:hypothetical protein